MDARLGSLIMFIAGAILALALVGMSGAIKDMDAKNVIQQRPKAKPYIIYVTPVNPDGTTRPPSKTWITWVGVNKAGQPFGAAHKGPIQQPWPYRITLDEGVSETQPMVKVTLYGTPTLSDGYTVQVDGRSDQVIEIMMKP
jgi:hypothetical protein